MEWQTWQAEAVERQIDGISPLLASWEKSTNPAQVRLRAYLDDLVCKLLPLPEDDTDREQCEHCGRDHPRRALTRGQGAVDAPARRIHALLQEPDA